MNSFFCPTCQRAVTLGDSIVSNNTFVNLDIKCCTCGMTMYSMGDIVMPMVADQRALCDNCYSTSFGDVFKPLVFEVI